MELYYRPVLAITMGDPSGIGPEIIVSALHERGAYLRCRPLVVGDAGIIERAIEVLKLPMTVRSIRHASEARYEYGCIDVVDLQCIDQSTFAYGKVSAQCGHAAFLSVQKAIELAMANEVDGTVTAPLNKEALNLAGHHFGGHTEIYAQLTGAKKYAMLLADEFLRVIHVSIHVSLRMACEQVKKDRIVEVTEMINDACLQFGYYRPRIGIAALNPHAGEHGLLGFEEEQEIKPAVEELRARGFNVEGPIPADTLFAKAKCGLYDGCVAMYHDQGHIPFKVVGFNWNKKNGRMESVRGVNITLGLPIVRVSVDHGTAFDLAGKGVASADALLLSIDYASSMAMGRLRKLGRL